MQPWMAQKILTCDSSEKALWNYFRLWDYTPNQYANPRSVAKMKEAREFMGLEPLSDEYFIEKLREMNSRHEFMIIDDRIQFLNWDMTPELKVIWCRNEPIIASLNLQVRSLIFKVHFHLQLSKFLHIISKILIQKF